jgi:hypothetical protein
MSSVSDAQIDLVEWARDLKREYQRIARINAERARRRGYVVFATDPDRAPGDPDYRKVFATEARTRDQAAAKVRPLAEGRRLHTYLATGKYRGELADARWVP